MYQYSDINHFFLCGQWIYYTKVSAPEEKMNTIYVHWQVEDAERREKNLEEAKKIVIENDSSLPEPKPVISDLSFIIVTKHEWGWMKVQVETLFTVI